MRSSGIARIASTILVGTLVCIGSICSANAQGAIDPRTGEFYPGTGGGGLINPRTGEVYPGTAGGWINPGTGEFYPRTGGERIDPNTGAPEQ